MNSIKITKLCPKCGLHREYALEDHRMGDPTALNLLHSCPECWKWAVGQLQYINNPQSGPVGTAKAGILNALQDLEYGGITIPMFHQAITAILEALVEDVQGGKNEQT